MYCKINYRGFRELRYSEKDIKFHVIEMQVSHANKICLVIIHVSQDTNKNKRVSKKPQGFLKFLFKCEFLEYLYPSKTSSTYLQK